MSRKGNKGRGSKRRREMGEEVEERVKRIKRRDKRKEGRRRKGLREKDQEWREVGRDERRE